GNCETFRIFFAYTICHYGKQTGRIAGQEAWGGISMASERHGKHNTTTISFRVNSYEKASIEERVKASGMKKQDYIVRSCIYNHVCVVGKKENIEILRSEMREMNLVLEDVARDLKSEKPVISEEGLDSMTERKPMDEKKLMNTIWKYTIGKNSNSKGLL